MFSCRTLSLLYIVYFLFLGVEIIIAMLLNILLMQQEMRQLKRAKQPMRKLQK